MHNNLENFTIIIEIIFCVIQTNQLRPWALSLLLRVMNAAGNDDGDDVDACLPTKLSEPRVDSSSSAV